MHSEALAEYLRLKQFWQNLGLSLKDLDEMPERQVSMLDQIMYLEDQFQANSRKQADTKIKTHNDGTRMSKKR